MSAEPMSLSKFRRLCNTARWCELKVIASLPCNFAPEYGVDVGAHKITITGPNNEVFIVEQMGHFADAGAIIWRNPKQ